MHLQTWKRAEGSFRGLSLVVIHLPSVFDSYKYRRFKDEYAGDSLEDQAADEAGTEDPVEAAYAAGAAKKKEKIRAPAWTDRIVWRSIKGRPGGLFQLCYQRADGIRWSDHRPVSAMFMIQAMQYNRHEVENLLLEAWRSVDAAAAAAVPRCLVEPNVLDLGAVG